MKKRFGLIIIVGLILSASLVSAQADSNAPYLYYYSRMLGGIIIEHPDGSDSRLIGSDVIPPNLTGIEGPGWSALAANVWNPRPTHYRRTARRVYCGV